ncbi:MAG TPA: hypothetical protein VNI52_02105 [Sphingobacteriaceae bacterium]|nr:hypothetical protein [Sphingobacteriaceae bacterium]
MENQVTIARSSTPSQTKFWFIASAVVLILLLNTADSIFNFDAQIFSMANMAVAGISIIAAIAVCTRKGDILLKIDTNEIEYFDFAKKQMISIHVSDIQGVSTRFGELLLSTSECTHCIDMTMIRDEKTRWEIKEMIRGMAHHEFRSLNMAG